MKNISTPQKVKVLAHWYSIKHHTTLSKDQDCVGRVDHDTNSIMIQSDMPRTEEAETIVHEGLHTLWQTAGRRDLSDDEPVVSLTAALFLDFLFSPGLLEYLMLVRDSTKTKKREE